MRHKQKIRFNKQGNEKYGYESGDIVVVLSEIAHPYFERVGNSLCVVKNIGLYESYAAAKGLINVVIKHLDGTDLVLVSDGKPLHSKDGARKIRSMGMPFTNKRTQRVEYGDLYIRFNVILPESFDGDNSMSYIEKLFPILPGNKDNLLIQAVPHSKDNFQKLREVMMEEVTPEDMEQLDHDDYERSESESDSE
jgi:DnaJ family protein A protein 2